MAEYYGFSSDADKHRCESWQEGDWIIFRCPECEYVRKMNWKTGDMSIKEGNIPGILHVGGHSPVKGELGDAQHN